MRQSRSDEWRVTSDPPPRGFRLRFFAAGQDGVTGEGRVKSDSEAS
jgi:hypothetical protein